MGVTIHFEGKLKSQYSFQKVIDTAKQFALSNDLNFSLFEEENKLLERVKDERNWNYQGPTKGILIQADINCDPFNLEFDKDLYIQEYCKTQFADVSVHILILDLLRQVELHFENLKVNDEGEYWDTSDITILQTHFDNCFKAIDEAKQEDKYLEGPFRLDNGRIIDLMSNGEKKNGA
jgi:hypothetical protein